MVAGVRRLTTNEGGLVRCKRGLRYPSNRSDGQLAAFALSVAEADRQVRNVTAGRDRELPLARLAPGATSAGTAPYRQPRLRVLATMAAGGAKCANRVGIRTPGRGPGVR